MSAPTCTLCNRPAVWSIHEELFWELHKEEIVTRYGVDFFPVHRLSETEEQFIVRGRHKQPVHSVRPPVSKKSRKPKAK